MTAQDAHRLVLHGLTKDYGATRALDLSAASEITFEAGEIHALAGENGAGKSTLVKIISGLVSPSRGRMEIDSRPYTPAALPDARGQGVEIVLQEPGLVPGLTVAENLFLGREARFTTLGVINSRRRAALARDALQRVGLDVATSTTAADLDLEAQKFVELARALVFDPRVLVIDEMSASLSRQGVERMSKILRRQAATGALILYISHYLEETFELCQRVTVLKDGELVRTVSTDLIDEDGLQTLMVGRSLLNEMYHEDLRADPAERPKAVLQVQGLAAGDHVKDFDLEVRQGEIVGLGGLVGCGNEDVAAAIFGVMPRREGTIHLDGVRIEPKGSRDGIAAGIGFVSGDREKNDLILQMPIQDNISLPMLPWRSRYGLTSKRRDANDTRTVIERLAIVCRGPGDVPGNLSGGNRQKVVLGKWLLNHFQLLILQNPTRGVDVGAKSQIYHAIRQIAADGTAVLLISDELNELLGMSDRIEMMRRGVLTGEFFRAQEPTEEDLIACMV